MIVLNVNKLCFSFGANEIFRDVTFSLDEGDRLGIIGVNGCGKSTLFRLIAGEYRQDSRDIFISRDKTLGILHQDGLSHSLDGVSDSLCALEAMYLSFPELIEAEKRLALLEERLSGGGSRSEDSYAQEYATLNEEFIKRGGLEFRARCASTLQRMGFSQEQMELPLSSLSGGQRTRLMLSRELCREPDILLLDEPTNHLDIETLSWLESYLSSYKKCLIVISHDRYFLDRVTNKTLNIEYKSATLYSGGYSASMEKRRIDREIAERHYKNQQKEIARQQAYIAQQRAWNRERNIIAAESRQKLLDKMEILEKPEAEHRSVNIRFSTPTIESGNEVLSVKNLGFSYSQRPLLRGLSFLVKKGERAFIVGPNGCGKSTLIKLLMGRLSPTEGFIDIGYGVKVGYYDQENQNLSQENSVLEELHSTYPDLTQTEIRNTLAQFRFFGDDVFKSVSMLSGGERARLTLSKLILSKVNLLILDEPTNHLDIASKEALEGALSEFGGTVVIVSHDRYFISKLATKVIDLTPIGEELYSDITVMSQDAYGEILRDRERRRAAHSNEGAQAASSATSSTQKEEYLRKKQDAAEQRRLKKRLERLTLEAGELEGELDAIEREMSGDAAYDYVRLSELDTRKCEIEERLLEIYEELEG